MNQLKSKIKYRIENCRPLFRASRYLYTCLFKRDRLPRTRCYGEKNPGKTVFVIRPNSEDGVQGLMSLFIQSMRWLDYARKKGYEPYIDYRTYETQYSDGSNIWDYYFTQPSALTYEEVYSSKRVKQSGPMLFDDVDYTLYERNIFFDQVSLDKCHHIIADNIRLSDEALARVEAEDREIHTQNCIGIYIRGTDYTGMKPSGEFVQPTVEKVIRKTDELLKEHPDKKLFLVTEDAKNYRALRERYGDRLLTISSDRFIDNYDGKDFLSKSNVLEEDRKKRGMDYLVKIVLLSRCSGIITSITRGSIAAYAMNGGRYESEYVFDLGIYP